jgi:hypothetical protein
MSVPNCLIPVVVCPLLWNSLELTQALVRDVGVYEGHFVPPKEQRPPPLVVSLKSHDAINKSKLVRTPPPPVRRHHQIAASGRDP